MNVLKSNQELDPEMSVHNDQHGHRDRKVFGGRTRLRKVNCGGSIGKIYLTASDE